MRKALFWRVYLFILLAAGNMELSAAAQNFLLSQKELEGVQKRTSDLHISISQMQRWDEIAEQLMKKSPAMSNNPTCLYAYLYVAQKAFADSAFEITGSYLGTLDSISARVLNLFYPDYQNKAIVTDLFSEEIATLLMKQIEERYRQEQKALHPVTIETKESFWHSEHPIGLEIPSMQPWSLKNVNEFRPKQPPAPGDPFWKGQLAKVKAAVSQATESQKERSFFWAKPQGSDADWRVIAQNYMTKNNSLLYMQLEVRAQLSKALSDALIASYDTKYTYWVARPFMLDSNLKTLFDTPEHPSYTAAHAVVSHAAATVLSYYFAEDQKMWDSLSEECSQSRLWAGVHFPIDLEDGAEQGRLIAKAVLFRQ